MEILFRGQRKYDKKWIFGNRVKTDNAVYIIQNYVPESELGEYEVYPDSVGQSVDLTAEDEKKIFTKDIIELTVFDKDGLDTQHICEVVFDQCGVYFINGNKEEGIFEAVFNFAETFPWNRLADSISYGINNAFDLDWETIRKGFSTACSELGAFISRMLCSC